MLEFQLVLDSCNFENKDVYDLQLANLQEISISSQDKIDDINIS